MREVSDELDDRLPKGHLKSERPIHSLNFARIPYITLNRNTPNCHALEGNFLLSGGVVYSFVYGGTC
jgi:hypothetical protein